MKHIEFANALKTFVNDTINRPLIEYYEGDYGGVHIIADFGNTPQSLSLSFKQEFENLIEEHDALLTALILLTPKNPDFAGNFDDYDFIDYQIKTEMDDENFNLYIHYTPIR